VGPLRTYLAITAALACAAASAQSPVRADVIRAPKIAFTEWRQIAEYDNAIEFETAFPSALESAYPANNRVPVRFFLPRTGSAPFPAVVIAHYWGASDLRAEISLADQLAQRGIASAILTLPYHLERTPPGKRSGEMAVQPNPAALRETMRQAALDVQRTLDFMESRPEFRKDPIGIAGTSLGALVAGLAYGTDDRITHAAFIVGGADIAEILWKSSRVIPQRDQLRREGYTEESLREQLREVEPLTHLPRTAPGTGFMIVAKYDTVIPGSASQKLIDAIPDSRVLMIDTGHYGGIFIQRRILAETAAFFGAEFAGVRYQPPKRIYAPSVRLGVSVDPVDGLDIGAGIDLARFDRRGDTVLSGFISPKGPSLRLSRNISSGLSVGVIAGPKKATIGLMWSTVL